MDTQETKVFICYARENMATAKKLYQDLKRAGVNPWMDKEDLLPGQNFTQAIQNSQFVIVLLSTSFVSKRGYRQKELKHALDVLGEIPDDQIFLIPARLEECVPTNELLLDLNWVDLFPEAEYTDGFQKILKVVCPETPGEPASTREQEISSPQEQEIVEKIEGDVLSSIVAFMQSLPNIHDSDSQRAFIVHAGVDTELQDQIPFGKPAAQFVPLLVSTLTRYGRLSDGRPALEAVLEAAKNYIGQDKRAYCNTLIQEVQASLQKSTKQTPALPSRKEKSPTQEGLISLRSELLTVSPNNGRKVFGLTANWRPRKYLQNNFEDRGNVVIDHAIGLMWQKAGSDDWLTYKSAEEYVKKLNRQQFAGYNDWRLPTIPELMSLLESEKQSNGFYINPIFGVPDEEYYWCWSADRRAKGESSSGSVWLVYFYGGDVIWGSVYNHCYVRCVRSRQ